LFRARLLRLAEDDAIVLLTMHHIIGDNWSSNVLIQELALLYDAKMNGRPSPLPPLIIQYPDFAAWQRSWLTGDELEAQIAYWKNQLHLLPPLLELPTDRLRPAVQTFAGDYRTFHLPVELSQRVRDICQAEQITLFMALLAAFQALLMRYSGQEDISIGSPIANRTRAELEGLIGFFVNTLVLRTDLSGEPSFRQLLQRVRETSLGAYAHQDLPFEMVVDALQPERNLSHSPLFQVMFVLQSAARRGVALPDSGLQLGPVDVHSGTAKFDLTLFMVDEGETLSGAFEFNTDLFDAATIERMIQHYEVLLAGMAAHLDEPVTRLPILTDSETRQILIDWNQTDADIPGELCAHQLFEAQVDRTPAAVALTYFREQNDEWLEENWTYQELNHRANRLGRRLQALGVGPETLVGLYVERSPQLVVGILGVLKAGGAYLPLDPTYPGERLRFMLTDSAAPVLLTQRSLLDQLQGEAREAASAGTGDFPERDFLQGMHVICMDEQPELALDPTEESLIGEDDRNLAPCAGPDNLCYVIYTSGSTGKPKGTLIEHRGLVNYLIWCQRAYPLEEGQGSPVHSSISFDLTITSIYTPLISGKRTILLPEGLGVELLGKALQREAHQDQPPLSLVKITPAHLQLLGEQLSPQEACHRTRAFIIGGENLTVDQIRFWKEHSPDTQLVNEYGPTETVVGCCVYWAPADTTTDELQARFRGGIIPIGRPIINTRLYILDRNMQPVPVGVAGELYIGGIGVGRGYLNRPDLTAERFIPNPISSYLPQELASQLPAGDRLYRTGDLARYLPDGNIECLGRIDFQVKIRGFRVELGEIEALLSQQDAVKEAVVWIWETPESQGAGHKNLVAYILPAEADLLDNTQAKLALAANLRSQLQASLPDYMVPAAFVFLQSMPLSINGKVDRKALPAPEEALLEMRVGAVAPRTPQEEIIASIWSEILHVPYIGVYDNFFELGGHSLLATQVISRLRDAFDTELPLRVLFESPTVAGLAAQVDKARQDALGLSVPPIQSIPRDRVTGIPLEPVPLSYAQQRLWILDQLLPGSPLYNIPAVIRLEGNLSIPALEHSLEKIVARHESLRTVFRQNGGRPVQEILPDLKIRLQVFDLSDLAGAEQEAQAMQIAMQEALRPFDLANGPLLRIGVLQTAQDAYTILLNTHHIISDDWSLTVFTREIFWFYSLEIQAEVESTTIVEQQAGHFGMLPGLPVQYADFAAWQRQWLQGAVLDQQMEYWVNKLAGLPPLLELPTDRPRPAVQTYSGAQVTFHLPVELYDGLRDLSRKEGATLFMILLAAFQVLLYRYTGQEDVSVGTPIANRTRSELESLIGFFVNTLVMRSSLLGELDFAGLLRQVRETALGAYAHQDVPFEMLVEALHPQRDMSHHPLFQVMFVLQNAPRQMAMQPGGLPDGTELTLKPVEMHEGIARFDLTLMMLEGPDGISASLEYNTDLFDQATIERMAGHYVTLIEGILINPGMPISDLPLLTKYEQAQILDEWSGTAGDYPQGRLVHELFEELAERQPAEIALVYCPSIQDGAQAVQLSYAELNRRANLLGHFLIRQGVKAESLVGICVERSPEQIIALLGILKAGGAYLPIDPAYPAERQAFMIEDAQIGILLTQRSLLEQLPQSVKSGCRVILLDDDWADVTAEPDMMHNPAGGAGEDNLAYVIYTSGSTGRPKGVMVRHAGLTNLVYQQMLGFGADAHSRILQFASFSFDASVAETLVALLAGGRLVLAHQDILSSPPDLLNMMAQQGVNMATLPPSLLRVLDAEEVLRQVPSLHTVISAGEACPKEIALRWSASRRFINAYGPTEATVGPTYFVVQSRSDTDGTPLELVGVPQGAATVPIGKPIANMKVYILDNHRHLIPAGVHGEIYLGGIGLARGYLNRPELTAEKFVANPFSPDHGERLYRTGDLARYLPDGNIEFLGRVDHQVKVRGFRIELGEIETLISKHPLVKTAFVMAREDRPGEKRLVAYLVLHDFQRKDELAFADLREFLKKNLPEYMIPSAYVTLEALPLTPNGKIDRRQLPAPEQSMLEQAVEYVAPRTDVEKTLADIWQEVIGLPITEGRPTAGVYDNFFEFGGDSILAIQLVARANQAGIRLTPRQLFERPTIAELAEVAEMIEPAETGLQQGGPSSEGKLMESDLADFGWSQDDLQDILGAIGSIIDEPDEPGE
jgi:amino acid adenylation domain-containing protein